MIELPLKSLGEETSYLVAFSSSEIGYGNASSNANALKDTNPLKVLPFFLLKPLNRITLKLQVINPAC